MKQAKVRSFRLQGNETHSSEIDNIIQEVKQGLRSILLRRKELIVKLGRSFEQIVSNPESISEEIKNALKEEIADKLISARDIERCCPDKWKQRTKPKNDNLSFSKKQLEDPETNKIITIDTQGNRSQDGSDLLDINTTINGSSNNNPEKEEPEIKQKTAAEQTCVGCHQLMFEKNEIIAKKEKAKEIAKELLRTIELREKEIRCLKSKIDAAKAISEVEFVLDCRTLQEYMAQLYKSGARYEVWLTVHIDRTTGKATNVLLGKKSDSSIPLNKSEIN